MQKRKCFCDIDLDLKLGQNEIYSDCATKIVGTKYVQLCEGYWDESRTQSTTRHTNVFYDFYLDVQLGHGQNDRYVAHLQWLCN